MTKNCGVCNKPIKTDDMVVMLGLAKFKENETSYDLALMAQTICSHVFCVEAKDVVEAKP